jgi:histidinol-phosphatase (PHP family)
MVDFHVHCEYSIDARGTVGEYVRSALEAGLSHVCFTTHCDFDPARLEHDGRVNLGGKIVDVRSDWLESYVGEVRREAASVGSGNLRVLCGLEIGYVPGIESEIEKAIGSHEFDFILCGVHTLGGTDIVSARESGTYFAKHSPVEVCREYFGYLKEAVSSGLFDSVAHVDIYKRCGLEFYGDALKSAHQGLAEPVMEEIARLGIALEVNSAGFRKGLEAPYPSFDILGSARAAGIREVTLGSDCHSPEDVGRDVRMCADFARRAGFETAAVFVGRKPQPILLEGLL